MARLRLTIKGGFPDRPDDETYEGSDAEEVMQRWNDSAWWSSYEPAEFRKHIAWLTGTDIEFPAGDDQILEAISSQSDNIVLEIVEKH